MRLHISNIGIIKDGKIMLDGLTVIASENDSGKSTAGKVLHCVIDTINTFEDSYFRTVTNGITSHFDNIIQLFKPKSKHISDDYFPFIIDEEENFGEHYSYLKSRLLDIRDKALKNIKKNMDSEGDIKIDFLELEKEIKQNINNFMGTDEATTNFLEIEHMFFKVLSDLKNFYDSNNDFTRAKNMIFTKELKNEFESGISNVFLNEKYSEISIEDGATNNCKIKINENTVADCMLTSKKLRLEEYKTNVIYIDSPLILDYMDDIRSSNNLFSRKYFSKQFFSKDIFSSGKNKKIENLYEMLSKKRDISIADELVNESEYNNLITTIQNIILGEVEYNQEERIFFYRKKNQKIELQNTAMGIKTFGIFQMLLNTRDINKNTLLIIDEPEVHLHPKWQIKYAKIIVLLVKELGLKVLLNSHSPFFIEAIEKYSKKYDLLDKTNYYTSVKDDSGDFAVIKNVNDSLETIYSLQAAAYDELDKDTIGDL